MRSASSYRGARKQAAKEIGVSLGRYNKAFDIAARQAENPRSAAEVTRQQSIEKLAIWARNGGRETAVSPPADLTTMNIAGQKMPPLGPKAHEVHAEEVAAAEQAAKKITVEDIDKALEKALTNWQAANHQEPMPMSPLFAARARALGWVEDVEFYDEGK